MPKLVIQNFDGEIPRTSDTFLPDNGATRALNVRLYSGELRTWDGPVQVPEVTIIDDADTFYKFYNPELELTAWLSWATHVHVQKSSLADEDDFRIYYTGDGLPKKTNWDLATNTVGSVLPDSWYYMGVPPPSATPSVADTAAGSSTVAETRYYVYTYVSTFGDITEESAPSTVSAAVSIATGRKVTVANMGVAPPAGYDNITHKRIYRTLPGEASDGEFMFVAEITVATASYVDDLLALALGEPLATTTWDPPPDNLAGLTSMANGMMAGFVGNSVYFSEPYFHHAWPADYIQSVPDQIVGLASYGNTLIVMTEGAPYAITGTSPENVTVERIAIPEPCVSSKSIVNDSYGVMYVSPNGIVAIGPTVRGLVSNKIFRRKEWQRYTPASMVGAVYDDKYFLAFQSSEEEIGNGTMVISRDDRPALSFLEARVTSWFFDEQAGELYYLDPTDDMIYQLDADDLNPFTYEWTSKRFMLPRAITWSLCRVDSDESQREANNLYDQLLAEVVAANTAIVGDIFGGFGESTINEYPVNGSLLADAPDAAALVNSTIFFLDYNDVVITSLSVENNTPMRIPPFKEYDLKLKLTGTLNVRSVTLATSMSELRGDNGQ